MRNLVPNQDYACLHASDFPSENPRIQTRNYSYTNRSQLDKTQKE